MPGGGSKWGVCRISVGERFWVFFGRCQPWLWKRSWCTTTHPLFRMRSLLIVWGSFPFMLIPVFLSIGTKVSV